MLLAGLRVLSLSSSVIVVDKPPWLRSVPSFGPTAELREEHNKRLLNGEPPESVRKAFERNTRRQRWGVVAASLEELPLKIRDRADSLPRTKHKFIKFCQSAAGGFIEEKDAVEAWRVMRQAALEAEREDGLEESDSVITRIKTYYEEACPVHRLDYDTSGVLCVALHPAAAAFLSRQWADRSVNKTYRAVVAGNVVDDTGDITLPLLRNDAVRRSGDVARMIVHDDGKPCRTAYTVLDRRKDHTTLVDLVPHTGRTHQLRAHLAALGHPILGDDLYGDIPAPRLCLHSSGLSFVEFDSRETWTVTSDVPF